MAHEPIPEYSFFSFWVDWLKKKTGYSRHELTFSEGLLVTLYCETDIGSIPRGAQPENYSTPKYKNNPNWSKHIIGCYWCGRDRTIVNGICCSKECIYYFHEWCVERVELFQGKRFCKLPGCDFSPTEHNHVCCNRSHNKEYEEMFKFVTNRQLRDLLIKGPSWYNCRDSFDKTPPVLTHNTPSKLIAQEAVRDLAKRMKSNLIHYTDVGPIPRSYKTEEHSASHFSKHDNWLTDIRGCYLCGMSVTDGSEYLCSYKCYLVFNEWCRRKVLKERGIKYCELPGCEKTIEHQDSFCGQDHYDRRDKYLRSDEYYKLLQKGPRWYKNTPSNTNSENTRKSNKLSTPDVTELNTQNTINISQHSQHSAFVNPFKRHLVFSETLTDWLYKCSDIGPIPRSLIRFPEVSVMNKLSKSNWNTDIPMCYWCCGGDVTNTKGIACSEKCFFLFSEWCHERYYKSTFNRICRICGCSLIFRKHACYTHSTEYSFYSKYTHLLKTSDYALGPQWYSDTKLRHIDFYNREDPFYEFTNFYTCPKLNLDAKEWKTTEHYFQAQKFVGTPHVEYVRKLDSPRSAFEYTRRSEVQKWVRPDWAKVKEEVMLKAVQEKFNQNQELGQLLIRTGDVKLFEHTRNDKFWGDGGDRRGENKLGMILMQVRFDLHAKCSFLPSRLCHIQESGSNPVSNTVVNHKDINAPNSQISPNQGFLDTKHSTYVGSSIVTYGNYFSKSDSLDLTPDTPSNESSLIDLTTTTSDDCTSSQNVVIQQPRTATTIIPENESSKQIGKGSYPPHQPVSTGVGPLDKSNNMIDQFLLPGTTSGKMNPFSESQEHYPTNNSLITQAVNDSDVTMQDDDTSKNDITLNFSLSGLKATQQLPVANTGDGNTPQNIPSSNGAQN